MPAFPLKHRWLKFIWRIHKNTLNKSILYRAIVNLDWIWISKTNKNLIKHLPVIIYQIKGFVERYLVRGKPIYRTLALRMWLQYIQILIWIENSVLIRKGEVKAEYCYDWIRHCPNSLSVPKFLQNEHVTK